MLKPIAWQISQFECLLESLCIFMLRLKIGFRRIMVTINILSQKSYFPYILLAEPLNLFHYGIDISTSLAAPDPRNNTKGAHIVAPSHDRQEC